MKDYVVIDLETRSCCDLKAEGAHRYARHETTRLLTVAWQHAGTDHVWLPGLWCDPPEEYAAALLPGVKVHVGELVPHDLCAVARLPWVGHNCWTFDRLVWDECTAERWPVKWVDTYPQALASGMPGGLDAIGKLLWGEGKYDAGKEALKKASRAKTADECEPENVPLGQVLLVAKYNVQDVRLTKVLKERLDEEFRTTPFEKRVVAAHDRINSRGMRIDLDLTRALVKLSDECAEHAVGAIRDLTDGALSSTADIQSRAKVISWLAEQGVRLTKDGKDCLAKAVVAQFIDHSRSHAAIEEENSEEDQDRSEEDANTPEAQKNLARVVKVLELRMQALRVTGGKLKGALAALDEDKRIRQWAVYWGATTGRWAGRKIQPHNFPRPKEGVDVWELLDLHASGNLNYTSVRAALPLGARGADGKLLYPWLSVDDAGSALLRSIILPDEGTVLATADLSNIEPRVLAWMAGEGWLLKAFWDDVDPYLIMARRIFGPDKTWPRFPDPKTGAPLPIKKHPYRQVGKVDVIGSGYGMGPDKFALYAAGQGVDLSLVGTTAAECIYAFRKAHPRIAGEYWRDDDAGKPIFVGGLWREMNDAAVMTASTGSRTFAGRCSFLMHRGNLICELPSGRWLTYRKPVVKEVETKFGLKPELSYHSARYGRKKLYGGLLCWGAGTRVVTTRGVVPIETVRPCDKVWDGVEWVQCDGAVCNGVREVGEWLGTLVTDGHLIHDGCSWSKVIHGDVDWSARCLSWARGLVPSSWLKAVAGTAPRPTVCARSAGARPALKRTTFSGNGSTVADPAGASTVPRTPRAPRANWPFSSRTAQFVRCGATGSSTSSREGRWFARSGAPTGWPLSGTPKRFPDGTNRAWTSNASTTRDITNRVTCASSPGIWAAAGTEVPVFDLLNCGPRHQYVVVTDYGPVLSHNCENADQAISRDVMANAIVLCEEGDMPVVIHVHDEVGASIQPDQFPAFMGNITTCPDWLPDLPLAAEGSCAPRYSKTPPPGVKDKTWRNGKPHGD